MSDFMDVNGNSIAMVIETREINVKVNFYVATHERNAINVGFSEAR